MKNGSGFVIVILARLYMPKSKNLVGIGGYMNAVKAHQMGI
jgi:hypothetical protein